MARVVIYNRILNHSQWPECTGLKHYFIGKVYMTPGVLCLIYLNGQCIVQIKILLFTKILFTTHSCYRNNILVVSKIWKLVKRDDQFLGTQKLFRLVFYGLPEKRKFSGRFLCDCIAHVLGSIPVVIVFLVQYKRTGHAF